MSLEFHPAFANGDYLRVINRMSQLQVLGKLKKHLCFFNFRLERHSPQLCKLTPIDTLPPCAPCFHLLPRHLVRFHINHCTILNSRVKHCAPQRHGCCKVAEYVIASRPCEAIPHATSEIASSLAMTTAVSIYFATALAFLASVLKTFCGCV